jgi:major vault protein
MATQRNPEEQRDSRELVLDPFQYALILDETKGNIGVFVGPTRMSLAGTDRPVKFSQTAGFSEVHLEEAIKPWPTADESSYIVLGNPCLDKDSPHPRSGGTGAAKLELGRKVNIAGPATFPLWPGQNATVIKGHVLRSNQYLVVRVYNEELAAKNWSKAIIKPTAEAKADAQANDDPSPPDAPAPLTFTTGQLFIIKGTEVAFYIPPTGVEVVPDEKNNFVRDAVTLERLEYCILLAESGEKRYVRGPMVVFPEPNETFIESSSSSRKFKAIDLSPISGLYVKVIAPYEDDNGKFYKEGDELFITGNETMIYFPRPEHAIIRYGKQEKHHAVAIPKGEARYVLDRTTGVISLVTGPRMFLPDPRTQVIVRRILDDATVKLWFPGNSKAIEVNRELREGLSQKDESVRDESIAAQRLLRSYISPAAADEYAGDDISRKTSFTPPRSISLDTKYDGAVAICPWTGYAVLVVSKDGTRKVVQGPQTASLAYDETLEVMELSTGTPKSDEATAKTVYLRVSNNKVSDIISTVTKDMVKVSIKVSYRVNFEGDPTRWFAVENYVKFLTDHLRSVVRNVVKGHGIESFNNNAVTILRDCILGVAAKEGEPRPGKAFPENGMRIYDVEILDLTIGDQSIGQMLVAGQHKSVQQAIDIAQRESSLEATRRGEKVQQEMDALKAETGVLATARRMEIEKKEFELQQLQAANRTAMAKASQEAALAAEQSAAVVAEQRRKIREADDALILQTRDANVGLEIKAMAAKSEAVKAEASAITPDMISALQAFGDKEFTKVLMEALGPHALLQGNSVQDILAKLIAGSPGIGDRLLELAKGKVAVSSNQK